MISFLRYFMLYNTALLPRCSLLMDFCHDTDTAIIAVILILLDKDIEIIAAILM